MSRKTVGVIGFILARARNSCLIPKPVTCLSVKDVCVCPIRGTGVRSFIMHRLFHIAFVAGFSACAAVALADGFLVANDW